MNPYQIHSMQRLDGNDMVYDLFMINPDFFQESGIQSHNLMYYFCRVFKRVMGVSPVRYQTEYRLRIADMLLKYENHSVSSVAHNADKFHFQTGVDINRPLKTLKAAIIGSGMIAETHIAAMRNAGIEAVGVYSLDSS